MDVHAVSGRAGCYYILCGCRAVCVEPFTGMGGRDFKDIDTLFGITIRHMDGKGYYVADTKPQSDGYKSLLFNMEILGLMDSDSSISRYVLPEKCRPVINVDFSVFFDAIRESKYVKFNYTYFRYGNKVSAKMVRPVFLKESQNRWYLVGYDRKDDRLKCFAIERMDSLGLLPENSCWMRMI